MPMCTETASEAALLKRIQIVSVKKNDILVLYSDRALKPDARAAIDKYLGESLQLTALVLAPGMRLEAIISIDAQKVN